MNELSVADLELNDVQFRKALDDFRLKIMILYAQTHPDPHKGKLDFIRFCSSVITKELYDPFKIRYGLVDPFTTKERDDLEKLVMAMYLQEWIECDESTQQTINSYAKHGLALKNDQSRSTGTPEESRLKGLRRAELLYHNMQNMRQKQAEAEEIFNKELPPKINNRRKYDFVTLKFIDRLSQDGLLWKSLVTRKEIMDNTADKGSNVTISDAYKSYDCEFERIKSISDPMEYVISCMEIQKYEQAFRFHLAAMLAKHILDVGGTVEDVISRKGLYVWGEYDTKLFCRPSNVSHRNIPYDVLNYEKEIQSIFGEEIALVRIMHWRVFLTNVLDFMNLTEPPREQPSWTKDDFADAAKFFREEYQLAEEYQPVDFTAGGKDPNLYYECIRELYRQINECPDSPLKCFRETMQENQQSRNKRKQHRS